MCRGGRMFAPTKIWRKWHVKTNVNEKRFAIASALAASALPSLVMARGHKIDNVQEIPLVCEKYFPFFLITNTYTIVKSNLSKKQKLLFLS